MELETLKEHSKIHMIGIGGVSMSGMAEHLQHFGFTVTGSDLNESYNTHHLQELGVDIRIGHHPEMIKNADLVCYTAAIKEDDVEILEAKKLNKRLLERSELLGLITKAYKECICISGTHGKTTTTSMIANSFLKGNLDPTIEVGAYLKNIDGNNRIGNSDYFILEACEYVDSFLKFFPHTIVILNIDNDHLDYFKNIQNIKKSFLKFTNNLNETGTIIANFDDENTKEVIKKSSHNIITYGIENEDVNFWASDIKQDKYGYSSFTVYKDKEYFGDFSLNVHGKHNILNALATIVTCDLYGLSKESIKEGLKSFSGANRRFEKIGEYKGTLVIDDYAHHPTEIEATYLSSLEVPHNDVWAVFEPHTYSRTKSHLDEFAKVLKQFDHVILAPIYAAREKDTLGVSSFDIEKLIKKDNEKCLYLDSYEKIEKYLKENVKKDDIIILIGAGTINKVGYDLIKEDIC